jgi:uncharacterized membrane protein YedE/YeeE
MRPARFGAASNTASIIRYGAALALAAGLMGTAWTLHEDPRYGRTGSFTWLSGAAFGVILQRSRFCFTSAFRDVWLRRDRRMMLALLVALAGGTVGYMVVFGAWIPDPSAGYLPPTAHIAPASWHLLIGGGSFGLGMVLARGCISRHLCRLGEGWLTAPVALAGTLAGFALGLASWRFFWVTTIAEAGLVWLPQHFGYAGAVTLQLAMIAGLALLLLRFWPATPPTPAEPATLRVALRRVFVDGWPGALGGLGIAILATFAFLRTEPLGVTSELGRAARTLGTAVGALPARLEGLDRMPGCRAILSEARLTEGGLFLAAIVAGSLVAALVAGEFRLRTGSVRAYPGVLLGGVLLGFGSALSLGCTVGTLLSGIMALSLSGWIFAVGLLGGSGVGTALMRTVAGDASNRE